jgi:glycosyltransferase involved in cell wall biosynthesis
VTTVTETDIDAELTGLASPPSGLVVLCAGNNYDEVKVADHHIAERLAQTVPLLYVDPPISHLSPRNNPRLARSLTGPRLRMVEAGFWRLTPVVAPRPMRPGMRIVTEQRVRRLIRRAARSIDPHVRALVTAWPLIDVFGSCDEQVRVWWAQDDFAGGAALMGLVAERVAKGERARAIASDFVVAANPVVAGRWQRDGHDVELIPFGSDPESFARVGTAPPAPIGDLAAPVAIVIGQLNQRVEPALLEAVSQRGVSLLMVGPADDAASEWVAALATRRNVMWVGPQPFSALPGFLARAHVGLVPYADSAFNRGCFPLKILEYLSGGLPVVTTELPAARWLNASQELVTIANGPVEFADAVVAAASMPLTPAARELRRSFARAHSYEHRAADLLGAIDRRTGRNPQAG